MPAKNASRGGRGAGRGGWGRMYLSGHRANALPAVPAGAVPVRAARIEVELIRAARVRRTLRTRPIVAVTTGVVEGRATVARCRQEDAATIGTREHPTLHAVLSRPDNLVAFVEQLLELVFRRHLPVAAPLHVGNVVLRAADTRAEVVAGIFGAVAVLVGLPRVLTALHGRLAPGVIAAVVLGLRGINVAASPLRARGKTQVNQVGMVAVGAGLVAGQRCGRLSGFGRFGRLSRFGGFGCRRDNHTLG